MNPAYEEEIDQLTLIDEEIDSGRIAQIIVYNDDVNTFDWGD